MPTLDVFYNFLLGASAGYALAFLTWVMYLAVMNIARFRHDLYPIAKAHAYVLAAVALVFDFLLNVVVGTVVFLKPPKDLLLTGRLSRYILDPSEALWRRKLAGWICSRLLDQFDPYGHHCDSYKAR